MPSDYPAEKSYEQFVREITLLDNRMTQAGLRLGLSPYPTDYEMVTDAQMVELMPSVMMPVHYPHWRQGKQALQEKQRAGTFHVFEAVLNTSPSICYLGMTNTLSMQALVMAHAKWGHVDFFANNRLFRETAPETVVSRFAQAAEKVHRLIEDPNWGWDGVEAILDAAHALEEHVLWLPSVEFEPESALREQTMSELRQLRARLQDDGSRSDFVRKQLETEIAELQGRLMRHPLRPTSDLLGFLADVKSTPHLRDGARVLLTIVRDRSLYFQPQARTKFMNEGWASYWEKNLLKQPEMQLPINMMLDLARYWTMHDRQVTNWYFDPYALGLAVFDYIDRTYGYDEPETEIEVRPIVVNEDGLLEESSETKVVKFTPRNRDKMLEVRRNYDDHRFIEEFMGEEEKLFEYLNVKALEWVSNTIVAINDILRAKGWTRHVIEPLPIMLEEMAEAIMLWSEAVETSQSMHQWSGTPLFPIHPQTLQTMGTVVQIVMAFDEDKVKAGRQLAKRTAYRSRPHIELIDTGVRSDGVWTLKHEYDPNFGPLLQSECRDTLKYFRRLCGSPCRLITMEQRQDRFGRPLGNPAPYEYFTEDGSIVKERFL